MDYRKEDSPNLKDTLPERQSRFVQDDAGWYFVTREGIKVGPYRSQFDAELGASLLITQLSQLDEPRHAGTEIHRFMNSSNDLVGKSVRSAAPTPIRVTKPAFKMNPITKVCKQLAGLLPNPRTHS